MVTVEQANGSIEPLSDRDPGLGPGQWMIEFKNLQGLAIVRNGPVVGEHAGAFVTEDVPQIGAWGEQAMKIAF